MPSIENKVKPERTINGARLIYNRPFPCFLVSLVSISPLRPLISSPDRRERIIKKQVTKSWTFRSPQPELLFEAQHLRLRQCLYMLEPAPFFTAHTHTHCFYSFATRLDYYYREEEQPSVFQRDHDRRSKHL